MLSKLQVGYLAGLLDGEGQVSIIKNKRNDGKKRVRDYTLRAEVRISQRRRILLETLLAWTSGECGSIGRTGKAGAYFVLRFHSHWLRKHLPAIAPHLILKRKQADIVMQFLAHPARVGRNGVGDAEWALRDSLHAEVKALNADRTNGLT